MSLLDEDVEYLDTYAQALKSTDLAALDHAYAVTSPSERDRRYVMTRADPPAR